MRTSNKRFIILGALLIIVSGVISAQETQTKMFVKTLYIDRVYTHQLGFRVDYRTEAGKSIAGYLPMKWFKGNAGKGEVVYVDSRSAPYMEIIYKDGKFSFIRLFVSPRFDDPMWAGIPYGMDLSDKFNIEAPALTF